MSVADRLVVRWSKLPGHGHAAEVVGWVPGEVCPDTCEDEWNVHDDEVITPASTVETRWASTNEDLLAVFYQGQAWIDAVGGSECYQI